jgi:hypothetical protein
VHPGIVPERVAGREPEPGRTGILAGAMRWDEHEHAGKDAGAPRASDDNSFKMHPAFPTLPGIPLATAR